jgi:putative peptidoglycan lipid II flippase
MADKSVMRGTIIIAVSVLLSRILGIAREILLADLAGLNVDKSAYDLAFLIPDIINHLISTGYLSITFIPLFTGFLIKGSKEEAWKFFSNALSCFTIITVPLILLSWIFIEPIIMTFTRPDPSPEVLSLAVRFSRIILPAQICFFVSAFFIAVQHVNRRFFLPALTGLIYNASIIIAGWIGRSQGLEGFAWGVLIGAVIGSLGLQIWGGISAGAKYRIQINFADASFIKYLKLTLPLILGLGAVFVLEYVYRAFGPKFGDQGIAQLGYAYKMMYTLVAVFGFSVGVASYPVLTRLAKQEAVDRINVILFDTISKILVILSPVILFFWFCAEPVTKILFQRGAFSAVATEGVAGLLKWYLWSAFALSSQVILLRCFYAMEKMWLPTLINTGIFLLTLPLYELFSSKFGIEGMA